MDTGFTRDMFDDPFFASSFLTYDLFRDNAKISTVLLQKQNGNKILIHPKSVNKIQVGDHLIRSKENLIVIETIQKQSDFEYYKTQSWRDYERATGTSISNVSQSQITLNSPNTTQSQSNNVTIDDIKKEAFNIKAEDQELFHELVGLLESVQNNGRQIEKHSLSKFGKLFKEYGPLALQASQFIWQILIS